MSMRVTMAGGPARSEDGLSTLLQGQTYPVSNDYGAYLIRTRGAVDTDGADPFHSGPDSLSPAQAAVVADSTNGQAGIPKFVAPRIVKQFSDLLGVTFSASNATYVSSIDTASPFGCPALKLVITWATTGGRVEVIPPTINIPKFNGHIGYTVWLDDVTKIGRCGVFVGTDTGYTTALQADAILFASGDQAVSGPRIVYAGPVKQTSSQAPTINTFTFGSDTAGATKLRIQAGNPLVSGGTATVWIKDCFIAKPQRPICCFTFDDGYDAWVPVVLPALAAYGYKATFGIDNEAIDGPGFITSANLDAVAAAGHQMASHNLFNYHLQTLSGQGQGQIDGSGTSQALTAYVADHVAARAIYEARGYDPEGFMYHPWVQGGPDYAGVEALWYAGVDVARSTSPYEAMIYGAPALYGNAMNLHAIPLAQGYDLANVKAKVLSAYQAGGLAVIMAHNFGSTTNSVQWLSTDFPQLVDYVASLGFDVLTMRELRDRFGAYGILRDRRAPNPGPQPVRCIGVKTGANMNSTADQAITLTAGSWKIEGVYVTKTSTTLAASSAAGGVYTAAAKGGTAIVAATQGYTGLTAATDVVGATMAATPTVSGGTVYFALTTAHGSAATASVFVFGRPA